MRAPRLVASLACIAPLWLLATTASTAHAQQAGPTPQQIKEAAGEFDLGVKAAQNQDFSGAGAHFENADRAAPSAGALGAAIRARRDAKQGARAATLAETVRLRYPDDAELMGFAQSVIEQFSAGLHKVSVACQPDCLLVVDNRLVPGEAAATTTLYLDPGQHDVTAGWGDKSTSERVEARAGASSSLSFTQPREPEPAPVVPAEQPAPTPATTTAPALSIEPSSPRASGLPPAVVIGGAALTAVLGGVTIWSGLDTQNSPGPDAVRQRCVGLGEACPEYKDGISKQHRTNALLAVTGGVAVATGVVALFFTDWSGASAKTTGSSALPLGITPDLGIGPQGASIMASGRFLSRKSVSLGQSSSGNPQAARQKPRSSS